MLFRRIGKKWMTALIIQLLKTGLIRGISISGQGVQFDMDIKVHIQHLVLVPGSRQGILLPTDGSFQDKWNFIGDFSNRTPLQEMLTISDIWRGPRSGTILSPNTGLCSASCPFWLAMKIIMSMKFLIIINSVILFMGDQLQVEFQFSSGGLNSNYWQGLHGILLIIKMITIIILIRSYKLISLIFWTGKIRGKRLISSSSKIYEEHQRLPSFYQMVQNG